MEETKAPRITLKERFLKRHLTAIILFFGSLVIALLFAVTFFEFQPSDVGENQGEAVANGDSLTEPIEDTLSYRHLPWKERLSFLREIIDREGVEAGFNTLRHNNASDVGEMPLFLGTELHRMYGIDGIEYCEEDFLTGCRAGVIRAEVETYGAESIKRICSLEEECTHGIGHGLLHATQSDLSEALEICNQAFGSTTRESRSCRAGVFQEYLYTTPDSEYSLDHPFIQCQPLRDSEISYQDCVYFQPMAWRFHFGLDLKETADVCRQAEDEVMTLNCIFGIGLFLRGASEASVESTCSAITQSDKTKESCVRGSVKPRGEMYSSDSVEL